MDEVVKSVGRTILSGILAATLSLVCLPASFMGGFWLSVRAVSFLSPMVSSQHQPEPPLTYPPPHKASDTLAFFALFDAVVVKQVGKAICIVGFVLWLLLLVVGKNLAVKLIALAWLLLAVEGVIAAPLWLH